MNRLMKESGLEWMKKVPEHWELARLKDGYSFEKGKNSSLYTQEYIGTHEGEYPVYSGQTNSNGIMGNIDSYDYDMDECLFTTTVGAKVMTPKILTGKFNLSQNCLIMKSNNSMNNHFVYHMLLPLFDYQKASIPSYMQPSLRVSDLNKYKFYVPPLEEQQKIASFLDERVAHIDSIIQDTKQSIENLKAYKQSLIAETVTKGLDPNVEMKDSGIEWIGEIPTNWTVMRLKYVLFERIIKSKSGMEEPLSMSQKYGLIKTKDMDSIPNMSASNIGNKIVKKNDLVFNKLKAHLGVFSVSNFEGIVSPDYAVYYAKETVNIKFLEYLFKSPIYISEFIKRSRGVAAGLTRLYTDDLFSIKCGFPNLDEQNRIVEHINKTSIHINSLIYEKEKLVHEFESFKKSLIYEYVTGKKEVE